MDNAKYAGFWIRMAATLIDTVWLLIVIVPLLTWIYGSDYWQTRTVFFGYWDLLLNYVFPAVAILLFWHYRSATPGKILLNMKIVDAVTGEPPSTWQWVGRYLAYYVSAIPLFLGMIWVGIDKRKQGWHDKLAGTVVVRTAD